MIYLDYNATTPVDSRVCSVMDPFFTTNFGNPSSLHLSGMEARKAVEEARRSVAALLGVQTDEIIFTGGGSESNNLAIKGAARANRNKGNHIITSSIEHPAVSEVCHYLEKEGFSVTRLKVDGEGMADPQDLIRAITPSTILISIMHANNETGTIQPLEEIGKIARERGILFHTDAAQTAGKIPVRAEDLQADLISLAGHKFYAPKGIGVLFIRRGVVIEKLIHGAEHEQNLRAGTENVPYIAGIGEAARLVLHKVFSENDKQHRDLLHQELENRFPEIKLNGHPTQRLPNTLNISFPWVEAGIMLQRMKTIAASAGAACHSGSGSISGVLGAMKIPYLYAAGAIRFSTGRFTSVAEIEEAATIIRDAYSALKPKENHFTGFQKEPGTEVPKLTGLSRSQGCACKIRPGYLEELLRDFPRSEDARLLVGNETCDDAAVYLLENGTAVVQSVDFIPPVTDDPYHFGAIAAANALSDIYAMGATPLFALNIVAFPENSLPQEVLSKIMRGAADKASEAGIPIAGGHSIDDPEPKFGWVVTGVVSPDRILRNTGGKPGDILILTKPIGTGIISVAAKRGIASDKNVIRAHEMMMRLNRTASEVMMDFPVNGCTDITGFGLLGHLFEMVKGSNTRAMLYAGQVPLLEGVLEYAGGGMIPGAARSNMDYIRPYVTFGNDVPEIYKAILSDAQTSGGLLFTLPREEGLLALEALRNAGIDNASGIGFLKEGGPGITVLMKPASGANSHRQ